MKQVFASCLLAVSSATLLTAPAEAGNNYYRWVNERGNVVHSDRPPPQGVDYEVVSTISTQTRHVDAEEGAVAPETKQSGTAGGEPPLPILESEVVKNPEKCEAAKQNLEKLDSKARIRMRMPDGEMAFLTPDQKEEQRQRAERAVKNHCE